MVIGNIPVWRNSNNNIMKLYLNVLLTSFAFFVE